MSFDTESLIEAKQKFKESITRSGIPTSPDEIIEDGEIHRFSTKEGSQYNKDGYYVFYANGIPAGAFGCWRLQIYENWSEKNKNQMNNAERRNLITQQKQIKNKREKERKNRNNEAKQKAINIWNKATAVSENNPYLKKKKVLPHGIKEINGTLIVPLHDQNKELWSVEMIFNDGTKRFLKGSKKKGCYYSIGNVTDKIFVVEGFATGASIHESTGHAVAIAFDAGNLKEVSKVLRQKMPQVNIVIAGDNDSHNQGQSKSQEAAKEIISCVAIPPEEGDWNDIQVWYGKEKTNELIQKVCYREIPDIYIQNGQFSELIYRGSEALLLSGLHIYNRSGQLVRPMRITTYNQKSSIRRAKGVLCITPTDSVWIKKQLNETSRWFKYYTRTEEWAVCDPPKEIAEAIQKIPDQGNWSYLHAITHHPILWGNGDWTKAGFVNEVLVDTNNNDKWQEPSKNVDKAKESLKILRHHLRYMPWESEEDESVALSLLMSSIMRAVIPTIPMHVIDAPIAATGKSLLVDVAAILATNARASVMDYGKDREEAAKRLDSMLLAGDSIIAIDNIETALEGSTLCQTLTQESRRIRVLGESTVVTTPCSSLITATGNNVVLKNDIVRRSVLCRLNAKTERPDKREIDQDIIQETFENREILVNAIQTIIRSYLFSEKVDKSYIPLASFEEWSKVVRDAILWIGMPDPTKKTEKVIAEDPIRESMDQVFNAIYKKYGNVQFTTKDLISDAKDNEELYEVLSLICLRKGSLNAHILGYWLRDKKDRYVNNMTLQQPSTAKGVRKWQIVNSKKQENPNLQKSRIVI